MLPVLWIALVMIKITRSIVFFNPYDDGVSDIHKENTPKPVMKAHTCDSSTWETDLCGFQASLEHSEFLACQ